MKLFSTSIRAMPITPSALTSKLSYQYVDPQTQQVVPLSDQLTYLSFNALTGGSITLPKINANASQLLTVTDQVNQLLSAIGTCSNDGLGDSNDVRHIR